MSTRHHYYVNIAHYPCRRATNSRISSCIVPLSLIRYDKYNGTDTDIDPFELATKWIFTYDSGRISCKIIHNTIENHIYIEDLSVSGNDNIAGYGQQLLEGILNYLDLRYPGVPIILNNASIIGSGEQIMTDSELELTEIMTSIIH